MSEYFITEISDLSANEDVPAEETVNPKSRTISGLILPFNKVGRTSRGPVAVDAGAVIWHNDLKRVKLLDGHRKSDGSATPVGYLESIEQTDHGLVATFKLGSGDVAQSALNNALEGIVDALSVELDALEFSSDGKRITKAHLSAVALVPIPAFSDARISEVVAQDVAERVGTVNKENTMEENIVTEVDSPELAAGEAEVKPASAPLGLTPITKKKAEVTLEEACELLVASKAGRNLAALSTPELMAAFNDITHSANVAVAPASWVGEVWSGVSYTRSIVPLLTQGSLKSYKVTGWRWVVKPTVAEYSGNKAAVPSNSPTTEAVTVDALRLAGGHDIDRKFIDFGDSEFLASYFRAMAESYAYLSDEKAADFIVASATDGGDAPTLLEAVAVGANKVKIDTRSAASFVLVNPTDYLGLLTTKASDVPAFMDVLGINPANWVASEFVAEGTVIVGTRPAATFYELAGSPIRVEAEHLANGGRDAALFGYYATLLNDERGIVEVTIGSGS